MPTAFLAREICEVWTVGMWTVLKQTGYRPHATAASGVVAEKGRRRKNIKRIGSHQGALGVVSRTDRRVAPFPENRLGTRVYRSTERVVRPETGEVPVREIR